MKSIFSILLASALLEPTALPTQNIPVPTPRPQLNTSVHVTLTEPSSPPASPEQAKPLTPKALASTWNETSPCAVSLKKLNVKFKILPPVIGQNGCAIAEPLEIDTLLDGVQLAPSATLDCPTALQFVEFTHDVMQVKAKAILGTSIKKINQASAYVCRTRHGTSKMSEHAFGRAIDIGSFTFTSGKTIPVMELPAGQKDETRFLNEVRKAACGPFKTVLGPGSDADHALHFHFDLAPRKGKAYCIEAAPKITQLLNPPLTKDSLLSNILNPSLRVEPCIAPSYSACALPQHLPLAPPNP